MGKTGKRIVYRAAADLKERGKTPTSGRMTAELSFGFWTKMFLPKYQETLWAELHLHFPDLPRELSQADFFKRCEEVRELRNRISHHEPIFMRDLSADYSKGLQLLSWMGPAKAAWIKPQLDTMKILRERP
jgi:hypothetical protein